MDVEDVVEGAQVVLASDSKRYGRVIKRDGQKVRVDFSPSGGRKSWTNVGDLLPRTEADVSSEDEDGADAAAPVPLTDVRYEAKLGRQKIQLEATGMGLQIFDKRSRPVEKHLYESMASWAVTEKGFDVQLADGKTLNFVADEGEAISSRLITLP